MSNHINVKPADGVIDGTIVPGVRIYARRFHVFIPYSESMRICDEITDLTEAHEAELHQEEN